MIPTEKVEPGYYWAQQKFVPASLGLGHVQAVHVSQDPLRKERSLHVELIGDDSIYPPDEFVFLERIAEPEDERPATTVIDSVIPQHLRRDDLCLCPFDSKHILIRVETPNWHLLIDEAFHLESAKVLGQRGTISLPNGEEVNNLGDYYDGLLGKCDKPYQRNWLAAYLCKSPQAAKFDRVVSLAGESIKKNFVEERRKDGQ